MVNHWCIMLFISLPGLLTAQKFTLESALASPYCSDLVVSSDGRKIAWTVNEKGIRALYSADAPAFTPERRHHSPYDDGQVLGSLGFDHQSRFLYFVKGSAPNRDGDIANPNSEVVYPQRMLYRVDLADNRLDTIGLFSNYIISQDDQYLLIAEGSTLKRYGLVDGKLETVIEMRGTFSNISLHPEGHSILFVSNRGDHNFIGIYRFGRTRIEWIGPALNRDQYPVWSPDGVQIAFIRAPGQRKGELADITGGYAFALMVYDIPTRHLREVWSSPSDDGWFAQYYHDEPLRWAKTGQLLFYSEHEGYMKIYQLDPRGGKAEALITGECEIEHSHLDREGAQLIFSSNCGDVDRRHLYLYDLRQNRLQPITQGVGIETDPLILSSDRFVYRKASHHSPTGIVVMESGAERSVFPKNLESSFPKTSLIEPRQVTFQAADGTLIHGQLFSQNEDGPKPGLLFLHGGPIRQMLLGYHYSEYYANTYVFNQYLASQGYVVLSVNYRSGTGYGKAFRRAANQGPRGASEYQDVLAAARYLQNLSYVDTSKIGLWGGSYGGLLTAQGLARNSNIFKAGVDFHGVHDWSWRATDFSKGGFWGITQERMELAYQSSPVADIQYWKSPVLLIHGDDDRNVMFGQSIDLAERLKERQVTCEVLVLPDEVHGFYRYESWYQGFRAAADFFNRYLKP